MQIESGNIVHLKFASVPAWSSVIFIERSNHPEPIRKLKNDINNFMSIAQTEAGDGGGLKFHCSSLNYGFFEIQGF